MNDLKSLAQLLQRDLPRAATTLDMNEEKGFGWLDIDSRGKSVTVEWRRGKGFGVSLLGNDPSEPLSGLFQGPDTIFAEIGRARDYILQVIQGDSLQDHLPRMARAL